MAGTPRCVPGCGCGKHGRSTLTRNDLQVLSLVFGFADVAEFTAFLARQDELTVRDRHGRFRERVV